ncbi:MAG TPA: Xaa-Pro peptidase family protein [Chloroflexia bacterium]|nr:Xaa-Pro peptidase family protein [Chloroflexia bacterium]
MALAKAPFDYAARLARIRQLMEEKQIDLLFIPPSAALQYLTGLKRQQPTFGNTNYNGGWVHGALIGRTLGPVLSLPRMATLFASFPSDLELAVLQDTADPVAHMQKLLERFGPVKRIAVEDRTWGSAILNLQKLLPGVEFVSLSPLITSMRRIKTPEELELMHKAASIVDQAHAYIMTILRPGLTYDEITAELDKKMIELGSEGPSFPTTLIPMSPYIGPGADPWAGGKNAADAPVLEEGTSLSFDYGSIFDGYVNDYGRSVWVGEPPAEYLKVYDLVISAQAAAMKAMKAGQITGAEANRVARQVIEGSGYGEHFFHRLGHGIGMDVHEPCYLDDGDNTVLEAGMTFTIEPSIFIPGKFGARIEDVFVVTENGAEPLNQYRRDLQVIS